MIKHENFVSKKKISGLIDLAFTVWLLYIFLFCINTLWPSVFSLLWKITLFCF